jgi:hypothetical protein
MKRKGRLVSVVVLVLVMSGGVVFGAGTKEQAAKPELSFWNMPFVTQEVTP